MTDTLKDVFLVEARDQLDALETTLLALERDPANVDTIHRAFRAAHTIKGSSGMADAMTITVFTHDVENVLDHMREGHLAVEPDLVTLLLSCADHIQKLVGFFAQDASLDAETQADGAHLLAQLKPWLEHFDTPLVNEAAPAVVPLHAQAERSDGICVAHACWHISLRLGQEIFQCGLEPIGLIRYLAQLGELVQVNTLTQGIPVASEMDAERCYLGFEIDFLGDVTRADLEDAFELLRGECELFVFEPQCALACYKQASEQLSDEPGWIEMLHAQGVLTAVEMQTLQAWSLPLDLVASTLDASQEMQVSKETAAAPALNRRKEDRTSSHGRAQLRVDADKLDKLVDLVGELVIAGAAAKVMASRVAQEDLNEAMSVVTRLIDDMRESAMQMRMVQIGATFNRFQRVVRDVALELGKEIELVTQGGDTELDKSVVEKIGDPLMHLVRNSIDHGIESAEVRLAAGKSVGGCIRLSAQHNAGSIVIEISDDGGGLNTQKILSKAVERKLVAPNQPMTDAEIHQLIFEPGFSTADRVTELSGRGVGMDVVRRNIQALRGSVTVQSNPGQGCVFTIRLPLTLAIIDGFRVGIDDAHFVIPLDMVVECIKYEKNIGSCDYLNLRGELLPYIRLREIFASEAGSGEVSENVVVVNFGAQKIGLIVERLYGSMQAVIKPLGIMFQGIKGLAGTTLLGGGEVAVILDIPMLIEEAVRKPTHA